MQQETCREKPLLNRLWGFRYCDFLLDQRRDAEVRNRAAQTLEWFEMEYPLLDVALDHLSLGRAHLLAAQRGAGNLNEATSHLKQAVDGLHDAGYQNYLPLGLLARAALHTHTLAFDLARKDLDEALTLASRCGFRLHEADAHLGLARLSLAEGDPVAAREHLDRARTIVDATGYHRRDAELAELDAACPAPLQAVDLLVILELAALGRPPTPVRLVAERIGLPESAVALSFHRLEAMRLLRQEGEYRRINKLALRQCLEHAVRWIAPAEVGGAELGLLTAHSAQPLASRLIGDDDPVVIPLPHGPARGRAVTPLHPLAPGAAARDPKLHTLLALVDAFRIGGAREREVAAKELGACL
jgi:tetratricopeptide (TPR) repeat protein